MAAESAIGQGHVALLFVDDGRLVELADASTSGQGGSGSAAKQQRFAALLSTDLWQAIKKLAPNKASGGSGGEGAAVGRGARTWHGQQQGARHCPACCSLSKDGST